LATEAEKMAAAAATKNADAIRAQMGPLGQACGGCHGGPAASGGTFRFERPS
jgi:cytochrome c556